MCNTIKGYLLELFWEDTILQHLIQNHLFPCHLSIIISCQGKDELCPLRAHAISYLSSTVQKVIFKALKSLKWRNDSLGKEFIILADSFPNGKEDLCFLRDSFFLFPFEYIHKTKRIQKLISTGKQLYPLFLLQGLTSSTFTENALTPLCKSLVSMSIQRSRKDSAHLFPNASH